MPYNGSGTFSLSSSISPQDPGSATVVMAILTDIRDGLTNATAKDGQSVLTGALKLADGSVSAPGLTFGSDLNTGIYRSGSDAFVLVANGAAVATLSTTGLTLATGKTLGSTADIVQTANITNNAVTLAKLATQANQTILANISGSSAVPTAATLTAIIDNIIGTTQGAILYRGASAWAKLDPGTNGHFLKTNGAAANPAWAAPTDSVASQTGNSGKLLTTNGTATSWEVNRVFASAYASDLTGTPALSNHINVTSITRTGTGTFRVVMTNAAANGLYPVSVTLASVGASTRTAARFSQVNTTTFDIFTYRGDTGGLEDVTALSFSVGASF